MKTAAIYARVSSDQQKEANTVASQTAALKAFAAAHGFAVPEDWVFEDAGYSGASLGSDRAWNGSVTSQPRVISKRCWSMRRTA
jgi:DNA invertase Pin-like site-specific DNA recombinase